VSLACNYGVLKIENLESFGWIRFAGAIMQQGRLKMVLGLDGRSKRDKSEQIP
jgi:hypothetical protein